jgi:hypothetical protein
MSLPVLNPTTFEPIGTSLPLESYFNPNINPNYLATSDEDSSRGLISIGNCIRLINQLLTRDTLEVFLPVHFSQYGLTTSPFYFDHMRLFYDTLPDDKKYLVLFTTVKYERERAGVYTFKFITSYPESISAMNEMYRTVVNTDLKTTRVNDYRYDPVPEQLALFQTDVNTNANVAHEQWNSRMGHRVWSNESGLPRLIISVYKYLNNAPMFSLDNASARVLNVPVDWYRPSDVKAWLDDGYRITFEPGVQAQGLTQVKCRPKPGDRRHLEQILSYSTNVLDHLPYTIKGPKEPKATLYGVELEACSDYTPKEIITAQKDLFFILKQDGSISGSKSQKYEMVSVPASLRAHKRLWAEFFDKVDYRKFDVSKDTGNGMHVHIDRKTFTKEHLNRFTWFVINPANYDFIFTVSERPTKANMHEWARVPDNVIFQPSKVTASRVAIALNRNLRGAIHFKSDKTVEIRLFKGIVSYATVVKNLEFVDSVVEYTRVNTLKNISLSHYLDWLETLPKNKYTVLKTFYEEAKVRQHTLNAQLTEYIWNTEYPEDVTEKLNKAPFTVTNDHITALNKKKRKRTYILKNGKVECVVKRGALLAKLDLDIQKKQTRGSASFTMTEFA